MVFYLYMYTHRESGLRYIGATMDLKRRHRCHKYGYSGAVRFTNAIKKYGIEAFDFRILAILDNKTEAARMEKEAIKSFGTLSPSGYNLNGGAPYTQYNGPFSKETCQKMSVALKGKKRSKETCQKISSIVRGRILSPETRKKISEASRGKPKHSQSIEARQKISAAQKGKKRHPLSVETRQKISDANKGQVSWLKGKSLSPEIRKKISETHRGINPSLETREKMSIAKKGKPTWNKGIPISQEQRLKQSIAMKGRKNPHSPEHCANLKKAWVKRKENKAKQDITDKV